MSEDNKSLIDRYPVQPGETLRLVIAESMDEKGNAQVTLAVYGKAIPVYYAMGLLEQMKLFVSDAADEANSTYLMPDTLYGGSED